MNLYVHLCLKRKKNQIEEKIIGETGKRGIVIFVSK
jgi:hypothetical protein